MATYEMAPPRDGRRTSSVAHRRPGRAPRCGPAPPVATSTSDERAARRGHGTARPGALRPRQRHLARARRPVDGRRRAAGAAAAGAAPPGDARRHLAQRLPRPTRGAGCSAPPSTSASRRTAPPSRPGGPARGCAASTAGSAASSPRAAPPTGWTTPRCCGGCTASRSSRSCRRRSAAACACPTPSRTATTPSSCAAPSSSASTRRPCRRRSARWRTYFRDVQPQLRVTAGAREAARFVLWPPMPALVQLGTPARPAWAAVATAAFAMLPRWARRAYSLPGLPTTDLAATAAGLRPPHRPAGRPRRPARRPPPQGRPAHGSSSRRRRPPEPWQARRP